jgi:hypothetical protein
MNTLAKCLTNALRSTANEFGCNGTSISDTVSDALNRVAHHLELEIKEHTTSEHQSENDPTIPLKRLISRLRTPGLKSEVEDCLAPLLDRVKNPSRYIPEAVADAEHDLKLLAGIEIEWAANKKDQS